MVLSLFAVAQVQESAPVTTTVTETLVVERHVNNRNGRIDDDDFDLAKTRLNLGATTSGLSLQSRIDGTAFHNRPTLRYKNDLRVERLTGTLSLEHVQLSGGDYFKQLGRGLVLSIRKEDEIGLDVALRGGEVTLRGSSHRVNVFAGTTNPANFDVVSRMYLRDFGDVFAGVDYALTAFDTVTVGAFGLYMEPTDRLLPQFQDKSQSGGAYIDWPDVLPWLALYLEGDFQQRLTGGALENGSAAYGTGDISIGDTVVLVEGIYLDSFEQRGSVNRALGSRAVYNRPPTLQRIEEEVANLRDVTGTRVRVSQPLDVLPLILNVNGLYRVENPRTVAAVRQLHAWGSAQLDYAEGRGLLVLGGGARDERQKDIAVKSLWHVNGEWRQPLPWAASLHIISNTERRRLASRRFWRGDTIGTVSRGRLELAFYFGYETQDPTPGIRRLFYSGIGSWQVQDSLKLVATLGSQRGGLRCVSGVCRNYPPFAGGRLEAVVWF